MGGTKKKPLGASAKAQDEGPQAAEVKKEEKKDKKGKESKGQQQKARISVILNEAQGKKALTDLKAITAHALARNTGVKISIANAFIKSLEEQGVIRCVGGYSGHKVYALKDGQSKPAKDTAKEETVQVQAAEKS